MYTHPLDAIIQIALATVLLNSAVSTTRRGDAAVIELGGELLRVLGHSLAQLLRSATPEPEALYRVLAAIGTLVVSSEVMVAVRCTDDCVLVELVDCAIAVNTCSTDLVCACQTRLSNAVLSLAPCLLPSHRHRSSHTMIVFTYVTQSLHL